MKPDPLGAIARPSVCNIALEPLVHSAHELACRWLWRVGKELKGLASGADVVSMEEGERSGLTPVGRYSHICS